MSLRPWLSWMVIPALMASMVFAIAGVFADPAGMERLPALHVLLMPLIMGVVLRPLIANPTMAMVPAHVRHQVRLVLLVGFPLCAAIAIPAHLLRGLDMELALGVSGIQVVLASIIGSGFGKPRSGWVPFLDMLLTASAIFALEFIIMLLPQALDGGQMILVSVVASCLLGQSWVRNAGRGGGPHPMVGQSLMARWGRAFAPGRRIGMWWLPGVGPWHIMTAMIGLGAAGLWSMIADETPLSSVVRPLHLFLAIGLPVLAGSCMISAWRPGPRGLPVLQGMAAWPWHRRSRGWLVMGTIAVTALPTAMAMAIGLAIGCLVWDVGGDGVRLALVALIGCVPATCLFVIPVALLAVAHWLPWAAGMGLMIICLPMVLEAAPMGSPWVTALVVAGAAVAAAGILATVVAEWFARREW
jgi:hypothetical protein